jgi:hypothetical protein
VVLPLERLSRGAQVIVRRSRRGTFPNAGTHRRPVTWAARIASVREAQLEDSGSGLTPVTQGWFVVNVRDAEWWFSERRGARCAFESEYGDPHSIARRASQKRRLRKHHKMEGPG